MTTVDRTKPRPRPMPIVRYGASFFFATGSDVDEVKQLEPNPEVEIILQWKEEPINGYIRLDGKAVKETNIEIVTELYERFEYFSKVWRDPEDLPLVVYGVEARYYDYMKPGEWANVKLEAKLG